jgi:hypothetical protein
VASCMPVQVTSAWASQTTSCAASNHISKWRCNDALGGTTTAAGALARALELDVVSHGAGPARCPPE